MPIEIEMPDGELVEFPDGMSDDEITSILNREQGLRAVSEAVRLGDRTRDLTDLAFEAAPEPEPLPPSLQLGFAGGQPSFMTQAGPAETPVQFALESRARRGPEFIAGPSTGVPLEEPAPREPSLMTELFTAPVGLGEFYKYEGVTYPPGSKMSREAALAAGEGRAPLGVPSVTSELIDLLPEGKWKDLSTGSYNAAARLFNTFISPAGVAMLGTGALPPLAQKAVSAKFAYDMAVGAPEELAAGDEAYKNGDLQGATQHWLSGAASLGMAIGAGAHATAGIFAPKRPPLIPEEVPNAREITSPESVLEPEVRPRVGEAPPLRQHREVAPEEVVSPAPDVGRVEPETKAPEVAKGTETFRYSEADLARYLVIADELRRGDTSHWKEYETLRNKYNGMPPKQLEEVAAEPPKPEPAPKPKQKPPLPPHETIIPAEDTALGKNAAGEKLYQRADGSVYRMRNDRKDRPHGYPDFGGDLSPAELQPTTPAAATAKPVPVSEVTETARPSTTPVTGEKGAPETVTPSPGPAPKPAAPAPTEGKPRPKNMAGQVRPERPKPVPAPAFESIHPKAQEKFNAAWDARDAQQMGLLLDPMNKGMRAEWERRTGEKLPKAIGDTHVKVRNYFLMNPKVSEAPPTPPAATPAKATAKAQEEGATPEVISRRIEQAIGKGAADALVEAKKAWAIEKDYSYRGLERLKQAVVLGVGNAFSISRPQAERMATDLIEGRKTLLDKLVNLEPIKESELNNIGTYPSAITKWGYERGERKTYTHPRQAKPPPPPKPTETPGGEGDVREWTSATEETPSPAAPERPQKYEGGPETELQAGIPIPKFANRKMSTLDQVTTSHSAKLQKSTDEARRAQREIKKAVPSERRQNAISIWREANGDIPTLQSWAASARGKMFKQAAIDAQSLTPQEIAIANRAIAAFNVMEARGNRFDVLRSHRDNYIPHVWDVARPGTGWGGGMLKQRFRFSKARTFNTFFEGDQAGFKPKTLAIGKLLPAYMHEMNTVIADRQMVKDIAAGTMPDGSPMATPRGSVKAVDDPSGKAVLVQPRSMREADTSEYRVMQDQPALSNWTWEGKDTDGKPVFVKADLALHPDVFRRVNSTIGQSALRTWYREPVSGLAQVPRAVARGLDTAQSVMKREMFGLLAPFHQVQEGTHAVGHLVNPFFGVPKVDLRNPAQLDAARHGLMLLPDRASSKVYLEGVGTKTSLLSRGIRKVGKTGEALSDVIDGYQDYLFHQYIPGLKFKTYEAMLGRNMKLYERELASGEMTPADVKITSAEQANAAYGHLNYALLDRNPTMQHIIQLAALAPDFLEARARFAGQGFKGLSSKVGHEQLKAIAILAAAQAGTSIILSSLLGVPYDPHHPFEVVYKGRRYAMRSVPEDIFGLLKDTRQFLYARVNPLTVKGGVQLATGLNYRGEQVGALDTMAELLAGYIPITARSLPGIRSLTETGRNQPVTPLQQLAGSLGLRISRYSPISETYKKAGEWMDAQKVPRDTGSYPVSKYQQLRYALEDGDMQRAAAAYDELRKTMTPGKITTGFKESINHPFTRSLAMDRKFEASLKGYDLELYKQALRNRRNILNAYYSLPKQ